MLAARLRRFVLILLALSVAHPAAAGCVNNPPFQTRATFPPLVGRLLLQWYSADAQGNRLTGTGQIGMYNFSQNRYYSLSTSDWVQTYGITDPMNPTFSPDGKWILFSAVTGGQYRDLYMYSLDNAGPLVRLTPTASQPGQTTSSPIDPSRSWNNLHPRFTGDGLHIYYDQEHTPGVSVPVIMNLGYTSTGQPYLNGIQQLTHPGTASTVQQQPFFTQDTGNFYVTETGGPNKRVLYRTTYAATLGNYVVYDATPGYDSFQPVVRNDRYVYFSKQTPAPNGGVTTQIYGGFDKQQLSFNDCNSNNTDPYPVNGTTLVFFSSTQTGHTELYLGDYYNGARWNLKLFGLNADPDVVYGAAYYQ